MNAANLSLSSINSSIELNSLDERSSGVYTYPISEGEIMNPGALEYLNNTANIRVAGASRKKNRLVKDAARWMMGYYLGNRLSSNIFLEINIIKDLKDTNIYGSVLWSDSNIRPREFDMELCYYINDRTLFRILAHEIVHVKQYATGDLKDLTVKVNYCKWKNDLILAEGRGSGSYFDLPWEKEARKYQEVIFNEWRKTHGYHFRKKSGEMYCD